MSMMRPRTALCGTAAFHDPHPLDKIPDDRKCAGLALQEAAAAALWRVLEEYVTEHTRSGQPLPAGSTLLAHPSVRHYLMRGLDPGFCSYPGEPEVFPPELPVIFTTSLAENEWRLVTITPVNGGVMP